MKFNQNRTNHPVKEESQLDKANKVLVSLAINVTTSDRAAARWSQPIVVDYLKGRGKDLDTAMEMIEFFQGRIAERDKKIDAASV